MSEDALTGRSIESENSVVALGANVADDLGTPQAREHSSAPEHLVAASNNVNDDDDDGVGDEMLNASQTAGPLAGSGTAVWPSSLANTAANAVASSGVEKRDSPGSNEPFDPARDGEAAPAAAAAAAASGTKNHTHNKHESSGTASPRPLRRGGDTASTAVATSHHQKHHQTKHVPKIVMQEREQRQRAAQEMLWMAPTVDDKDRSDDQPYFAPAMASGGGSRRTSVTTGFDDGAGPASANTSGGFPPVSPGMKTGSGSSTTAVNNQKQQQQQQQQQQQNSQHGARRVLQINSSPSSGAMDEMMDQPQRSKDSAAGSGSPGMPRSGSSFAENPLSGSHRSSDASSLNSPSKYQQNNNKDASGSSRAAAVVSPTTRHKIQQHQHDRGQSFEYFVKTGHGGAKASILFDSQQEMMQLSGAIGHGRQLSKHQAYAGYGGGASPAGTAAGGGGGGGGSGGPHSRTTSASHGRVHSYSRHQRGSSSQQHYSQNRRPSAAAAAAAAVAGTDEYNFTPEQIAAMNAFDDGRRYSSAPGTAAPTAPGGASRRTPSASAAELHHQRMVSSEASPKPAAGASSGHSKGPSLTFYKRGDSSSKKESVHGINPLGTGGGGSRRSSQQIDGEDAAAALKSTAQQRQERKRKREERAAAAAAAASPPASAVMYAGFGPRDRLEVPDPPFDSAWRQNTLPSIRVELGARGMLLLLVVVIATCVPLGVSLLQAANEVRRVDIYYDQVREYKHPVPLNTTAGSSSSSSGDEEKWLWTMDIDGTRHRQGLRTFVRFNLSEPMKAPILFSYGLTNFHQNHLNVLQSKSLVQMAGGQLVSDLDSANCEPILNPGSNRNTADEQQEGLGEKVFVDGKFYKTYRDFMYHPCGSLPWAKFNDSFVLWRVGAHSPLALAGETLPVDSGTTDATKKALLAQLNTSVFGVSLICNGSDFNADGTKRLVAGSADENPCEKKLISVRSDGPKFSDPDLSNNDGVLWMNTAHQKVKTNNTYLRHGFYADEPGHELPNVRDLDFQIWMRVAPLPSFRKLYRVVNVDLPAGQYQLEVDEYFDSTSFGGRKFMSLESRPNRFGGSNYTMAGVYLATGALAFFVAVLTAVQALFSNAKKNEIVTSP